MCGNQCNNGIGSLSIHFQTLANFLCQCCTFCRMSVEMPDSGCIPMKTSWFSNVMQQCCPAKYCVLLVAVGQCQQTVFPYIVCMPWMLLLKALQWLYLWKQAEPNRRICRQCCSSIRSSDNAVTFRENPLRRHPF